MLSKKIAEGILNNTCKINDINQHRTSAEPAKTTGYDFNSDKQLKSRQQPTFSLQPSNSRRLNRGLAVWGVGSVL